MRQKYEMSQADLDTILYASQSNPVMFLSGGTPMFNSQRQNVNDAWQSLGEKMGFKWDTARPTGEGDRFFTAVPIEKVSQ